MPLVITNSTEKLERGLKVIPDLAHRGQVSAAVAVVRRTPDCDDVLVCEMVFVAFVDQLVGAGYQG